MGGKARDRGVLEQDGTRHRVARELLLPVQHFIATEWASSVVLLAAASAALIIANSPLAHAFHALWETKVTLDLAVVTVSLSLHHWVNDGLMALFFFVVGLEIKRELLHGHLSSPKRAALPAFAALGGMVGPALIYLALNVGGEGSRGWGIPMATDIAFALGVLGLLGRGIPTQLRIFLLALAIVDDLGAILVIAFFYTEKLTPGALVAAAGILGFMFLLRRLGVRATAAYIIPGFLFWIAFHESGIHATLAGVILGVFTPASHLYDDRTVLSHGRALLDRMERCLKAGDHNEMEATSGKLEELMVNTESPLERLERKIHPWAAFVVLPIFALVNAGVEITSEGLATAVRSPIALGIAGGLVLGKLVGIVAAAWLAVRIGAASLPDGVCWRHIAGVSLLGGIGFTVSLFITELAFTDPAMVTTAKLSVLVTSAVAGVIGFLVLKTVVRRKG
ncbi:MAG: Na+/H+ antiporter NhaA [Longimicrobiales bacterium]